MTALEQPTMTGKDSGFKRETLNSPLTYFRMAFSPIKMDGRNR